MKKQLLAMLLAAAMTTAMGMTALAAEDDSRDLGSTETVDTDSSSKTETDPTVTETTGPITTGAIATDVAETDWFYNAVVTVVDTKIMETTGGRFQPHASMTREQIAIALFNDAKTMKMETVEGGMAIKEAPDYDQISAAGHQAMTFCFAAGILTGDEEGYLNPQDGVTREEMAALLQRYCTFVKLGDAGDAEGMAVKEFTDYATIQSYAHAPIQFCMHNGVLKGNADGSFRPLRNVTRAECAQMITNIIALVAE